MKCIKMMALAAVLAFGTTAYTQSLGGLFSNRSNTGAGSIKQSDNEVVIEGAGNIRSITMDGGTLRVDGASNTITVKGFVSRIVISGAGNRITADKVNSVSIQGASNNIHYRSSDNNNGRPSVSITGAGNSVQKLK